ncbi:hypothetical protein [Mycobacterium sp. RTGN3]|uniref:hypothetical protein n=1 Tax=Mycobacterium sp. RTGN3 TaxID=3016524 RepID=UPI0029C6AF2D|nr:hypothetical protein [Mycobacterium sp. RTGN3]
MSSIHGVLADGGVLAQRWVYWGSGSADCWWSREHWCSGQWPDRLGDTTTFGGSVPEDDARGSESAAENAIDARIRDSAASDHECWKVGTPAFRIEYKKIE